MYHITRIIRGKDWMPKKFFIKASEDGVELEFSAWNVKDMVKSGLVIEGYNKERPERSVPKPVIDAKSKLLLGVDIEYDRTGRYVQYLRIPEDVTVEYSALKPLVDGCIYGSGGTLIVREDDVVRSKAFCNHYVAGYGTIADVEKYGKYPEYEEIFNKYAIIIQFRDCSIQHIVNTLDSLHVYKMYRQNTLTKLLTFETGSSMLINMYLDWSKFNEGDMKPCELIKGSAFGIARDLSDLSLQFFRQYILTKFEEEEHNGCRISAKKDYIDFVVETFELIWINIDHILGRYSRAMQLEFLKLFKRLIDSVVEDERDDIIRISEEFSIDWFSDQENLQSLFFYTALCDGYAHDILDAETQEFVLGVARRLYKSNVLLNKDYSR